MKSNESQQRIITNKTMIDALHTISSLSHIQSHHSTIPKTRISPFSNHAPSSSHRYPKRTCYINLSSSSSSSEENDETKRPKWAASWMPTSLITIRPMYQLCIGLVLYIFHLMVLQQHSIPFPVQLIPNEYGRFQSIGCDSLAGILSLVGLLYLHQSTKHNDTPSAPNLWSNPTRKEAPWRFPKKKRKKNNSTTKLGPKNTSILTLILLIGAYFNVGRLNDVFADFLDYATLVHGIPISTPMFRSLTVLLGHLTWVSVGSFILSTCLRPRPFFGGGLTRKSKYMKKKKKRKQQEDDDDDNDSTVSAEMENENKKRPTKFKWYTNKWNTYWLWWTIGGYYVSSWLFNIADFLNQIVLPLSVFEAAGEGVVSQLINPENNDFLASLVGYIAPCVTAPWWEEVLYRGYLFPALNQFMSFWPSVFTSGILFSIHHLSTTGAIPLAMLGFAWAVVYAKSGNLMSTILIHAMWNSRVFLGSWLGL